MKATFLHQAQLHLPLTTAQGPLDPLAHCLRVACACTIHRAKGKVAKISYFMAQFVRWCTPLSEGKESISQNTWQGLWSIYLACKTCICKCMCMCIYIYIHGWDIYSINIMQELHPRVHGQAYGQPTLVIIPNFLCLAQLPSHPVTKFHAIVSDTIIHIR